MEDKDNDCDVIAKVFDEVIEETVFKYEMCNLLNYNIQQKESINRKKRYQDSSNNGEEDEVKKR